MSARAALSLSQATEGGTIYRVAEVSGCRDRACAGMALHVDGARIGNALARMNVSPAEATWKAGVDALSFGATKGGAMGAEAVIFFDPARRQHAGPAQAGGALASKHRFIAAQMEAYLEGDLWLTLARHANDMADRAERRADPPPAQAGVAGRGERDVRADPAETTKAEGRGRDLLPVAGPGVEYGPDETLVRLVTSFQTTREDVRSSSPSCAHDLMASGFSDKIVRKQSDFEYSASSVPKLRPIH